MLILVDHLVDHDFAEISDSDVLYCPELAAVDEHVYGRELARMRPDALVTRRPVGGRAARDWRTACSSRNLIVVMIGPADASSPDVLPVGIISCVVQASEDSLVEALIAAENAWTDAASETKLATARVQARAARGRSVAMVGAGVVNLVTAVRLAREGHAVTIYEQAPDPRVDAHWTDYGCSRGGGDARMFSLTEADGYYFDTTIGRPDPLRTSLRNGGWRVTRPASLTDCDLEWASANAAVPRWLAGAYTSDILSFNRAAGALWDELVRAEPSAFDGIGLRSGILRLYTDRPHLRRQIARQEKVGANPVVLTPDEIATRHPALGEAVFDQVIAGGIEVPGFTVQAHAFLSRLVDLLVRSGVRFAWGQQVSQVRRDASGAPCGLWVGDEVVAADHLILSTGVYGGGLLVGTASEGLIHGVLGVWLTVPGGHPTLENSLKIGRRGHLAEDTNVTVANGPDDEPQLIIGSGYGWTGHDPSNIDSEELDRLYEAVEDTARTFFPRPFAQAQRSGLLRRSRRFCVRPWTASSLGVLEMAGMADGGVMVITGGHNTGGFAQAPVVAEAVSAALQGRDHPMHSRYHPDRLRDFRHARHRRDRPDRPTISGNIDDRPTAQWTRLGRG